MSQPTFYVSPEQQIKDRAEFARGGIAKGRSVIVAACAEGVLFVGENRSKSLRKMAEIYDRIGFAAVGRYNEFENLRVAGIRHADIRGYAYDRRDVTGRMLAGAYAQLLGAIFSAVMEKPYEVELVVAQVGAGPDEDQIFRVSFDGSISDEAQFAVIGGAAEAVSGKLRETYGPQLPLRDCLKVALLALGVDADASPDGLEVALLDRTRSQTRKFRRVEKEELATLLAPPPKRRRAPRKTVEPASE